MGYVTPVLLFNDSLHMLKDDPYFTQNLDEACRCGSKEKDVFLRSYKKTWIDKVLNVFGLYRMPSKAKWRGSSDFAQVLPSRHADDARVIVIWGNTWEELSTYYSKAKFAECHDAKRNYIKSCVKIAERDLKMIKAVIKEYEEGIKNEPKTQ